MRTAGFLTSLLLSHLLLTVPIAFAAQDRLQAVHLMRDGITRVTASVGAFTGEGPELASLRPADKRLIGVTYVPNRQTYYGVTAHYVGPLDAQGNLQKIEPPESMERLSWVGGVAYDASAERLLIVTKGGDGFLYEYLLESEAWRVLANLQGLDLETIAWDASNRVLHGIASVHAKPDREFVTLNEHGAVLRRQPLVGPSFFRTLAPIPQLGFAGDALHLLISHDKHPRVADELWRIDPMSGAAVREPYNSKRDLTAGTWPGWPGGPKESVSVKLPVAVPFGGVQHVDASAYVSPTALTVNDATQLHVVAVEHGGLQLGEYLKKIKRLNISASDSSGVRIELETNPEHEVQPPVVEIDVAGATKPVVLALASRQKMLWHLNLARGAQVQAVYLFGRTDSMVAGVPAERIRRGSRELAVAWELERGGEHFDAFIASVRRETGLFEASYQGAPMAQAFQIPIEQ